MESLPGSPLSAPGPVFAGRLAIQQRVLPAYRAPFFDLLAGRCQRGAVVLAGAPRPGEGITQAERLQRAEWAHLRTLHLFSGRAYLYFQRGLLAGLRQARPTVLVLEINPRCLSNLRALAWARRERVPVLGWGLGAPMGGGRWSRAWLAQFTGLIAYSEVGAQSFIAAGVPPARVSIARNAVAPRPQSPLPARPNPPVAPLQVLFVGRLQARKRVDLLLRACAALPAELQPGVTIVGDGPERAALQALAAQVYPTARFVGEQRGPALDACFQAADLFVLPGTGGLAVQQAMAHGLPVMVGEADGTQADLVRPASGWQLRPGDLADLTARLREALSNPTRLRQMGAEAYRISAEEINLEAMADAFIAAVQKAAAAGS